MPEPMHPRDSDGEAGFSISLAQMGTFEGALSYTLAVAESWDVLRIPTDKQVLISGLEMRDDEIINPGEAFVGPRGGGIATLLADSTIEHCTVLAVANVLIDLAHGALDADAPASRY